MGATGSQCWDRLGAEFDNPHGLVFTIRTGWPISNRNITRADERARDGVVHRSAEAGQPRSPQQPPTTSTSAVLACDADPMEMTREPIIDEATLGAFCRRHGIRRHRLFGSALRDELRTDSDIDLFVESEPGRTPGMMGIAGLELELQTVLGREVEMRTPHDLRPRFRDQVVASSRVSSGPPIIRWHAIPLTPA